MYGGGDGMTEIETNSVERNRPDNFCIILLVLNFTNTNYCFNQSEVNQHVTHLKYTLEHLTTQINYTLEIHT